ncbi:MAG: hypothetical protein WDN46_08190 [Methylocella sp.]
MISLSAQAAHRRGIAQRGEEVIFQRISGVAPRTVTFSAVVSAMVANYQPDGQDPARAGYGASQPGSITQGDRQVIVMIEDLAQARFPLPVQKNDNIILSSTGEKLNVTRVDMQKRAFAGAIELGAAGVA